MKKWDLQNSLKFDKENFDSDKLIKILLENRGLKTKKEIDNFLSPSLEEMDAKSLGINEKDLELTIEIIKKAIKEKTQIVIFGDYDVDGIAGSAVLWESLNSVGAKVMPYIPHRVDEGYGLSEKGIENVLDEYPNTKIIITVDNGIVASGAVKFANSKNLEVIITDHHQPEEELPKAFSIVHSTKICGAAVAWFLSKEFSKPELLKDHLGLVALASVTDVMPLTGFNRTLVSLGLVELRKTKRPGIIELLELAAVSQENIGVYELGHIIGPRLNAMGRIEHAMDSLRFLCTKNLPRARELANKLHITNRDRQQLTFDSVDHAKKLFGDKSNKLIFISDKSYQPGVVGLISGRLTEQFYRPSIVISEGVEIGKASCRSVAGFNIIEFIRKFSDLIEDKGGHPMAAGFSVKTENIPLLKKRMEEAAEKEIDDNLLIRNLKIDCELDLEFISFDLFDQILKLSPFGHANPEPTFMAKNLEITDLRFVGKDSSHLKLNLKQIGSLQVFKSILFGYDKKLDLKIGSKVDVVYNISLNEWNGNKSLELKMKDVKSLSLQDLS